MFRRPGSGRPIDSYVWRPMMIGCPMVNALNRAMSAGSLQGSDPSRPITPFSDTATMRETITLHRDRCLDPRMRIVIQHLDVLEAECEEIAHIRIEAEPGQGSRLSGELKSGLLHVIEVEMHVPERVHEVAGGQAAHLRHHVGEERVGRDVEGNAQEYVRTPLIELARQATVGDIELEEN